MIGYGTGKNIFKLVLFLNFEWETSRAGNWNEKKEYSYISHLLQMVALLWLFPLLIFFLFCTLPYTYNPGEIMFLDTNCFCQVKIEIIWFVLSCH